MLKLNGHIVEWTVFPDQTIQVWKLPDDQVRRAQMGANFIQLDFEDHSEIMALWQLVFLLRTICTAGLDITLYMPYLPYARQDKDVSNDETFGLFAFANILNVLNFRNVVVDDVHSDTAKKLICSLQNISPEKRIKEVIKTLNVRHVMFPDAGAYTRYKNMLPDNTWTYTGKKIRNGTTGEILAYKFEGNKPLPGSDVLIVDDICDGGRTFIEAARLIHGCNVHLYVTHGLFTKGLTVLRDAGIRRIFTMHGEAGPFDHLPQGQDTSGNNEL